MTTTMICEGDRLLARDLGVPVEAVVECRSAHLSDEVHFVRKKKGGGVEYTAEGREVVQTKLGLRVGSSQGVPEGSANGDGAGNLGEDLERSGLSPSGTGFEKEKGGGFPPPAPPVRERLRILYKMPNPIWVRVMTPDRKTADVRVRTSAALAVGAVLECELQGAAWVCVHQGVAPVR